MILRLQSGENRPARRDSKVQEYFVADAGGQIVGCAAVRAKQNTGYLYGMVVNKAWRKRGIGHALTDARLTSLEKSGVTTAFGLSMFWNLRFFRKHGFTVVQRTAFPELQQLHGDFLEGWSRRSALISLPVGNRGRQLARAAH